MEMQLIVEEISAGISHALLDEERTQSVRHCELQNNVQKLSANRNNISSSARRPPDDRFDRNVRPQYRNQSNNREIFDNSRGSNLYQRDNRYRNDSRDDRSVSRNGYSCRGSEVIIHDNNGDNTPQTRSETQRRDIMSYGWRQPGDYVRDRPIVENKSMSTNMVKTEENETVDKYVWLNSCEQLNSNFGKLSPITEKNKNELLCLLNADCEQPFDLAEVSVCNKIEPTSNLQNSGNEARIVSKREIEVTSREEITKAHAQVSDNIPGIIMDVSLPQDICCNWGSTEYTWSPNKETEIVTEKHDNGGVDNPLILPSQGDSMAAEETNVLSTRDEQGNSNKRDCSRYVDESNYYYHRRNLNLNVANSKFSFGDTGRCYYCRENGHICERCPYLKSDQVLERATVTEVSCVESRNSPDNLTSINVLVTAEIDIVLETQTSIIDKGCEQSAILPSVIFNDEVNPTCKSLSAASNANIQLLEETNILRAEVAECRTESVNDNAIEICRESEQTHELIVNKHKESVSSLQLVSVEHVQELDPNLTTETECEIVHENFNENDELYESCLNSSLISKCRPTVANLCDSEIPANNMHTACVGIVKPPATNFCITVKGYNTSSSQLDYHATIYPRRDVDALKESRYVEVNNSLTSFYRIFWLVSRMCGDLQTILTNMLQELICRSVLRSRVWCSLQDEIQMNTESILYFKSMKGTLVLSKGIVMK